MEGRDAVGTVSTFPADGADSRALYVVDDGRTDEGPLHRFRLVMTSADARLLHRSTNVLSNERLGSTVIYNDEAFYNKVDVLNLHLKKLE